MSQLALYTARGTYSWCKDIDQKFLQLKTACRTPAVHYMQILMGSL